MEQEVFNQEVIQKNIITKAISCFDTSSILNGVDYNLYNAFNFQVLGPTDGEEIKLTLQKLTGSDEPSILVENQTNARTLIPVQEIARLRMVAMSYELPLDDRKIKAKTLDPNLAITQAVKKLEAVMWSLLIKGSYGDTQVLANSLLSQGNISASPVKFNDESIKANQILKVFAEAKGKVTRATGKIPNVLLIDPVVLDSIGLADTTIANFMVNDYLTKQLGLTIYPTSYLSDVKIGGKDLGSCFVLMTNSPDDLQGIIGELPFIGKTIDNSSFSKLTSVQSSFAGFCRLNSNVNSIQIVSNLMG